MTDADSHADFAWPGRSRSGSVVLPVPWGLFPALAPDLELPEGRLLRKRELHLTLLSATEAGLVAPSLPVRRWAEVFRRQHWSLRRTGERYLMQQCKGRILLRSVIEVVDCPALNRFRRELGAAAGAALPDTVPHVTLWVAGGARGIGIESTVAFEQRQVRSLVPGLGDC